MLAEGYDEKSRGSWSIGVGGIPGSCEEGNLLLSIKDFKEDEKMAMLEEDRG